VKRSIRIFETKRDASKEDFYTQNNIYLKMAMAAR